LVFGRPPPGWKNTHISKTVDNSTRYSQK
jgi:hypothetical protein